MTSSSSPLPPRLVLLALLGLLSLSGFELRAEAVRIGTFDLDATPPVGAPLAYDEMVGTHGSLRCRGIVLLSDHDPVVLCAVDWIGIGNGGNLEWRRALADAAGTSPDRVSIHSLHQHDAPTCDFTADALMAECGMAGYSFDPAFARQTINRAAEAVRQARQQAQPVSHIGLGAAEVHKVASNRRILGPDGTVQATRWTATRDPKLRAAPTGIIDPELRMLSFWNHSTPVAVLTFYATHPQSYYRTGHAAPDFPGIARAFFEHAIPEALPVHFNGAGGDIGAGKWNDGSPENRPVLAGRLADGMLRAWENTKKIPVQTGDVQWHSLTAHLPIGSHLQEPALRQQLENPAADKLAKAAAAFNLAFLQHSRQHGIPVAALDLGPATVLLMPGELAVEYQLAAQDMAPDRFITMAAYSDYGPGYICLEEHYPQGGYEASPRASRVAPRVEHVLMEAMHLLLKQAGSRQHKGATK